MCQGKLSDDHYQANIFMNCASENVRIWIMEMVQVVLFPSELTKERQCCSLKTR